MTTPTPCACDTNCKALLRMDSVNISKKTLRLLWSGKLQQTCDQCGFTELAGGVCTGRPGNVCGHFPPQSTWEHTDDGKTRQKHKVALSDTNTHSKASGPATTRHSGIVVKANS